MRRGGIYPSRGVCGSGNRCGGVKTAWRRTTSAASQQSWPAHAVVCPAGANIVRSPVSLRSTVVPRLQPRPSLRFAVHGCLVGSGLDRSGNLPSGSPFPGAAHVGAAYMRPAGVRKTGARGPGRGPGMPGPYLRFAVHGCPVGSGLDRSGNLPSGSPFPGAAHVGAAYMRPAGVRKTGACGPGRGPGMPGPYRYITQSRDKNVRSFHEQI